MGLGTKNRQKQTADICKQHLREKYRDQLGLVEEFIVEIEGVPKNCDVTRWASSPTSKTLKKRCSSVSRFTSKTGSIRELSSYGVSREHLVGGYAGGSPTLRAQATHSVLDESQLRSSQQRMEE